VEQGPVSRRARTPMSEALSQAELEAEHCWDPNDRVPGRPGMTAFRRSVRLHQSRWRESNGHPIGTQPIRPRPEGPSPRLVGSRLPLDYALETGANFPTAPALEAARTRAGMTERQQSVDWQGMWADLLSSTTMCFNLFGDLSADLDLADRAVHTWWPGTPGHVRDIRFEHSPGRLDPAYIGNLSALDTAVVLDLGAGRRGVVGVEAKYHERIKREIPKPARLARYVEVAETSGAFGPGAIDAILGTDLLVMWLDHLLLLSMVQHPSGTWRWGRLVNIHPAGNTDYVEACERYRSLLVDDSTFAAVTLEELLDAGALPPATAPAFRARYLPG
jgi:PD-(D/E)XK nuclease superfamily